MRPLSNKVIVERVAGTKTTASGIVLGVSQEPDRAKILSVGPEAKEVAEGETVLLNWNAAQKIKDERYIIAEDHIIFVFEEE